MARLCDYRAWLVSDDYATQMRRLLAESPKPSRADLPIDYAELSERHRAHTAMCIEAAVRHMRMAIEMDAMQ